MDNLKKTYNHSKEVQIRFNDIDVLGHVNNAVYQNYFDIARYDYFQEVFSIPPNWSTKSIVLAQVNIQYFVPIKIEEQIFVYTKITELGNKSFKMTQLLVNENSGEIKSENNAVLVTINVEENQAISIPEDWKKDIENFEKTISFKH